jgi:hypothetical protein
MSKSEVAQPTPEQIAEAALIIEATYDPETGRHPLEIFYAICRTTMRPVVELVIFSPNKDKVLLTERPEDDPFFPDMWHLPGVVVVPSDVKGRYPDAQDNAALRVIDELEGTKVTPLQPLSPKWIHQGAKISRRGAGMAVFYGGLLMDEEPAIGKMFDIDGGLPASLVEEHGPQLLKVAQRAMCVAPGIDMPII